MSTSQQQTIPAPASFTHRIDRDELVDNVTYDVWDGPHCQGVQTTWTSETGVVLTVDGYPDAAREDRTLGFDLTPETARELIAHLGHVLDKLERSEGQGQA